MLTVLQDLSLVQIYCGASIICGGTAVLLKNGMLCYLKSFFVLTKIISCLLTISV